MSSWAALALGVTILVSMPDDANKGKVAERARAVATSAGCEVSVAEFEPSAPGSLLLVIRCREMKTAEQRRKDAD